MLTKLVFLNVPFFLKPPEKILDLLLLLGVVCLGGFCFFAVNEFEGLGVPLGQGVVGDDAFQALVFQSCCLSLLIDHAFIPIDIFRFALMHHQQ